jgi:ERCC4-type nuclease
MTEFLIDTREQKPLPIKGARIKLDVGDYTTKSLRHFFCIERKSAMDLYQTITRGHARFKREILRAKESGVVLVVVVECSKKHFYSKAFDYKKITKIKGTSLERIINTLTRRYDLEFVWRLNRKACQRYVVNRLKQEEKNLLTSRKAKFR